MSKAVLHRLSDALAVNELPPRLAELLHRLHEHYRYLDQQVHDVDVAVTRGRKRGPAAVDSGDRCRHDKSFRVRDWERH